MGQFRKAIIKLKQKLNSDPHKLISITRGPLKGVKWNLNISDPNYLLGDYEKGQTSLILEEMKSKKTFLDVGANSGYFSLAIDNNLKNKELFLFEPLPQNIQLLTQHFNVNFPESNYQLFETALGEEKGSITFSDSGNNSANTYKEESSLMNSDKKISVEIDTLDNFSNKYNWDSDVLIKVDIEGAELDFLKGGEKYLSKHHPTMILATHDCHVPNVERDCLDFVKNIGYKVKKIKDDKISGQNDFLIYI